jgi:hypothetical protein
LDKNNATLISMKESSQVQKFISVLMIFILLAYLSGCTSTRIISTSGLPHSNSGKDVYIIHGEKIKFLLDKSTISNGVLSGRISQTYFDNSYDGGNKIHLYVSSDSVIKIDNKGEFLSVPLVGVTQVSLQEVKGVETFFIILGSALVLFIVVGIISWIINPPDFSIDLGI